MTNVDLARWQFAFTSINHFLFVPVTIGLAFLTALLQTAWHRGSGPGGRPPEPPAEGAMSTCG
jgi:cytochrome d ubiquinol oxidase subunit I